MKIKTKFNERDPRDRIEYSIMPPGEFPKKSETGAWRYRKPVIDYDNCIQCMRCVEFCPDVSVEIEGDEPVINYRFCKGCGICVEECPVDAITWSTE